MLSDRLKLLEQEGLVASTLYSKHPPRAEYRLTEKGESLRPILQAFVEWGNEYAPRKPRGSTSNEAVDKVWPMAD